MSGNDVLSLSSLFWFLSLKIKNNFLNLIFEYKWEYILIFIYKYTIEDLVYKNKFNFMNKFLK